MRNKTSKTKTSKNTSKSVYFTISRIELVHVNKNLSDQSLPAGKYNFKVSVDLSADREKSLLLVKIGYTLYSSDIEIFSMSVDNEYKIRELATFIVNKKFTDKNFIEFITDLSLNQTRGMHATLIKDTVIDHLYIPFVKLDNMSNEEIN